VASGNQDHSVGEFVTSYRAIRRAQIKQRQNLAHEIKSSFAPNVPLILHWDGKIMEDFSGSLSAHQKVERLPILVSGFDAVKLLAVPKLHSGMAVTMVKEIIATVDDWKLRDRIKGLCFDTTAANTGIKGGVCVLLEAEIGRELIYLACRHHISETVLQHVFSLYDVSKSGDIELFGHFREYWPRINQAAFSSALNDNSTAAVIVSWKDSVISYAVDQLQRFQPRDDYCELLELTIIFLGGCPPRGVHFRQPGAIHRARWMAKAIYCIKMWLFRNKYKLQPSTRKTPGTTYESQVWEYLKKVSLFVTKSM